MKDALMTYRKVIVEDSMPFLDLIAYCESLKKQLDELKEHEIPINPYGGSKVF